MLGCSHRQSTGVPAEIPREGGWVLLKQTPGWTGNFYQPWTPLGYHLCLKLSKQEKGKWKEESVHSIIFKHIKKSSWNANKTKAHMTITIIFSVVLPSSITFAIISTMFLSPKFIFLFLFWKNPSGPIFTYWDLLDPGHMKGKKIEPTSIIHEGSEGGVGGCHSSNAYQRVPADTSLLHLTALRKHKLWCLVTVPEMRRLGLI